MGEIMTFIKRYNEYIKGVRRRRKQENVGKQESRRKKKSLALTTFTLHLRMKVKRGCLSKGMNEKFMNDITV